MKAKCFFSVLAAFVLALALERGPLSVSGASSSSSASSSASPLANISARFSAWRSGKSATPPPPQESALPVDAVQAVSKKEEGEGEGETDVNAVTSTPSSEEEAKKKKSFFSGALSFVPGLLFHLVCLVTYMWYSQKFYSPKAKEARQRLQSEAPDGAEPSGAEVLAAVKKESPNTAVALESLEAMVMTSLLTVVAAFLGKKVRDGSSNIESDNSPSPDEALPDDDSDSDISETKNQ